MDSKDMPVGRNRTPAFAVPKVMAHMLPLLGLVVAFDPLLGCATPTTASAWKAAPCDLRDGKVITMWVKKKEGDVPVTFQHNWAMLVIWTDRERYFYLFENRSRRFFATRDFLCFVRELDQLPNGAVLEWIDTCTVSRSWKMPAECRTELLNLLKKKGVAHVYGFEDGIITCYCESQGLRYLEID